MGNFIKKMYLRQQKLLWDNSWIISREDYHSGIMSQKVALGSRMSMMSLQSLDRDGSSKINQLFCSVINLYGKIYSMKSAPRLNFTLTKKIRIEVKTLRTLNCQNLTEFIGAFIDDVQDIQIFMEYCPKGSLSDVLQNENIPLNWAFRLSLAKDASNGILALHNEKIIHGHLNSNNCVVDDRWTCKITDYGLDSIRYNDPIEKLERFRKLSRNFAYIPIEFRENNLFERNIQNMEFDVFSFGVILCEIATREDAYGDKDPDSLNLDWLPDLPGKSHFIATDDETIPNMEDYTELILSCWADPTDRPTFQIIKKTLTRINPCKKSPVDLMMSMMEKYSKHLETVVAERTKDLIAEKAKTDQLLYSMLPQAVADQLRIGNQVNAEWFDECSIYFSDIVGFTTISAGSTPIQVVKLLNKLYTEFDQIIDQYNVYKVETIGDAYMVVSGVPIKNGNLHAREIANMSLDIVKCCTTFQIPHLPDEPLKIRVGCHSGPVCAGVVGLKMPRYCLFGDTVNTASRMESNGEAYRIHVSEMFAAALKPVGNYQFEERGDIEIKGKGTMKTYWLLSSK